MSTVWPENEVLELLFMLSLEDMSAVRNKIRNSTASAALPVMHHHEVTNRAALHNQVEHILTT